MALITVFQENNTKNDNGFKTNLGANNGFTISLHKNAFWKIKHQLWHPQVTSFTGINLENISIGNQIKWGESGGAKIANKLKNYLSSGLVKALASQGGGYTPFILTDEWSQQKAVETNPISVSLKFRLYNESTIAGSSYKDALTFLFQISSPPNSLSIFNNAKNNFRNVFKGAENIVKLVIKSAKKIGENVKDIISNKGNIINKIQKIADTILKNVKYFINNITSYASSGINNANFTALLSIPGKINSNKKIDWIITNWTFTPSTQFQINDEDNKPYPIWIDFTVNLETRLSLSDKYLYNLLIPIPKQSQG